MSPKFIWALLAFSEQNIHPHHKNDDYRSCFPRHNSHNTDPLHAPLHIISIYITPLPNKNKSALHFRCAHISELYEQIYSTSRGKSNVDRLFVLSFGRGFMNRPVWFDCVRKGLLLLARWKHSSSEPNKLYHLRKKLWQQKRTVRNSGLKSHWDTGWQIWLSNSGFGSKAMMKLISGSADIQMAKASMCQSISVIEEWH